MLKIAFCDDDLEILKELGILLDKYKKERGEDPVSYTHLVLSALLLLIFISLQR